MTGHRLITRPLCRWLVSWDTDRLPRRRVARWYRSPTSPPLPSGSLRCRTFPSNVLYAAVRRDFSVLAYMTALVGALVVLLVRPGDAVPCVRSAVQLLRGYWNAVMGHAP